MPTLAALPSSPAITGSMAELRCLDMLYAGDSISNSYPRGGGAHQSLRQRAARIPQLWQSSLGQTLEIARHARRSSSRAVGTRVVARHVRPAGARWGWKRHAARRPLCMVPRGHATLRTLLRGIPVWRGWGQPSLEPS
jgi:hypothetical protein